MRVDDSSSASMVSEGIREHQCGRSNAEVLSRSELTRGQGLRHGCVSVVSIRQQGREVRNVVVCGSCQANCSDSLGDPCGLLGMLQRTGYISEIVLDVASC